MYEITVPNMNDSIGRITLDEKEFYIRFTYNPSYDYWSFGLYDTKLNPIIPMTKIVPLISLYNYYKYTDLPEGIFVCFTRKDRVGKNDFLEGFAHFSFATREDLERDDMLWLIG